MHPCGPLWNGEPMMDATDDENNPTSEGTSDDTVADSVMDSMAAALESAGISLAEPSEETEENKKYSEDVLRQVLADQNIEDEEGFITFAKTMDGDENGYLNKRELLDAAEAWLHMNENEGTEQEMSVEEEVNALLQQGEESSRKNDSKKALAAFNKAISIDPSCDMAWFNRGVLLEAQQDARGARQAFQICLDLNEEHAPATANLAILLERIGDETGAYEMATRALVFFPGHPTLSELQSRCKGSNESIEMEAMPIVEPTQTFSEAQVKKAMQETGATDREAVLAEAVHHDDGNENLEFSELMAAAEVVAATEVVEINLQGQPALLHEAVEPLATAEHETVPLPERQQTVVSTPPLVVEPVPVPQIEAVNLDSLVEQATELIKAGAAADALNLLKPHLKTIGAQHAPSWRIAGGAMARLNLDDHAIGALTHAQSLDPSQASGWFNLGSIHQRRGEHQQAITAYMSALGAQPDYLKASLKCSILCYETGDIENYLIATRSVLSSDANNAVRTQLIEVLIGLAEGEANVIESAQGLPPTLPEGPHLAQEALQMLGVGATALHARAHTASNDHVQAVTTWKALIQNDGTNPVNWRGLARALENAGDLETAQKCHAKATALDGTIPPSLETNPAPVVPQGTTLATLPPTVQPSQPAPAPAYPAPAMSAPTQPAPEPSYPAPALSAPTQPAPEPVYPAPAYSPPPQEAPEPPHPDEAAADFYMGALGLNNEPQAPEFAPQAPAAPAPSPGYDLANDPLMQPLPVQRTEPQVAPQPEVDLAKAALDAAARVAVQTTGEVNSMSIANQDIAWYNQGVQLIEDGKYDKALSSFDRAIPSFANDEDMLIRILNGKGNAYYYLEQYPKCVESYHQAMLIRPAEVRGKTLYNMGSAYAEMERYPDAIKCFEQSIPRGLLKEEVARAKDQIRRCSILQKERDRKRRRA